MDEFITPFDHVGFAAKKLCGESGAVKDAAIAYIQPSGGGPIQKHTHAHNHLFIVTEGEARIEFEDETIVVKKNSSYLVRGERPHSVWNNTDKTTVMIEITVI